MPVKDAIEDHGTGVHVDAVVGRAGQEAQLVSIELKSMDRGIYPKAVIRSASSIAKQEQDQRYSRNCREGLGCDKPCHECAIPIQLSRQDIGGRCRRDC